MDPRTLEMMVRPAGVPVSPQEESAGAVSLLNPHVAQEVLEYAEVSSPRNDCGLHPSPPSTWPVTPSSTTSPRKSEVALSSRSIRLSASLGPTPLETAATLPESLTPGSPLSPVITTQPPPAGPVSSMANEDFGTRMDSRHQEGALMKSCCESEDFEAEEPAFGGNSDEADHESGRQADTESSTGAEFRDRRLAVPPPPSPRLPEEVLPPPAESSPLPPVVVQPTTTTTTTTSPLMKPTRPLSDAFPKGLLPLPSRSASAASRHVTTSTAAMQARWHATAPAAAGVSDGGAMSTAPAKPAAPAVPAAGAAAGAVLIVDSRKGDTTPDARSMASVDLSARDAASADGANLDPSASDDALVAPEPDERLAEPFAENEVSLEPEPEQEQQSEAPASPAYPPPLPVEFIPLDSSANFTGNSKPSPPASTKAQPPKHKGQPGQAERPEQSVTIGGRRLQAVLMRGSTFSRHALGAPLAPAPSPLLLSPSSTSLLPAAFGSGTVGNVFPTGYGLGTALAVATAAATAAAAAATAAGSHGGGGGGGGSGNGRGSNGSGRDGRGGLSPYGGCDGTAAAAAATVDGGDGDIAAKARWGRDLWVHTPRGDVFVRFEEVELIEGFFRILCPNDPEAPLFSDPAFFYSEYEDTNTASASGVDGTRSSHCVNATGSSSSSSSSSDRALEPVVPLPLARAFFARAKLPSVVLAKVLTEVTGDAHADDGGRGGARQDFVEEKVGIGRGAWFLACKLIGLAQQQQQQQQLQLQLQLHSSKPRRAHPPSAATAVDGNKTAQLASSPDSAPVGTATSASTNHLSLATLVAMAPTEEAAVVAGAHVWPLPQSSVPAASAADSAAADTAPATKATTPPAASTAFSPLPDFHIALGPAPPPPPPQAGAAKGKGSAKGRGGPPPDRGAAGEGDRSSTSETTTEASAGNSGVRRPRPTTSDGNAMPVLDVRVHSPRLVEPQIEAQQQQQQHRHEQQFRNHRHSSRSSRFSREHHEYQRGTSSGLGGDDDDEVDDDAYDDATTTTTTMGPQRTMRARTTTSPGSNRSSGRSHSSDDDDDHRRDMNSGGGQDTAATGGAGGASAAAAVGSSSSGGWRDKLKRAAVAVTHVAESAASASAAAAAAAIANRSFDTSGGSSSSSGDPYSISISSGSGSYGRKNSSSSSSGSPLNSAALAYVASYARGSGREGGTYTAYALYTRTSLPWYPKPEVGGILRRYKDFEWLHARWRLVDPACLLPPLPPKRAFAKNDEQVVRERVDWLNQYMRHVSKAPRLMKSFELQAFLCASPAGFQAAKLMMPAANQGGLPPHPPPPPQSSYGDSSSDASVGHSTTSSASHSLPDAYVEAWLLAPPALWDERYRHHQNHQQHQHQQRHDQDGRPKQVYRARAGVAGRRSGQEEGLVNRGSVDADAGRNRKQNDDSSSSSSRASNASHNTATVTATSTTTTTAITNNNHINAANSSSGYGTSLASLGSAGLRGLWGGMKATAMATAAGAAAASQRALDPALPLPRSIADESFEALAEQRKAHASVLTSALDRTKALHEAKRAQVAQVAALGFALKGASGAHALLADRQRDRELEGAAAETGSVHMYDSSNGHRIPHRGSNISADGGNGGRSRSNMSNSAIGPRSNLVTSSSSLVETGGLSASLVAADDGTAFDVEALGSGLEVSFGKALEHLNAEFSDCLVPLNFQRGLAEAESAVVNARHAARKAAADAAHCCKVAQNDLVQAQAALPSSHRQHVHHQAYVHQAHLPHNETTRASPRERPASTLSTAVNGRNSSEAGATAPTPANAAAVSAPSHVALAQQGVVQANATSALARAHLACFSVTRYREEAARCDALRAADLKDFMITYAKGQRDHAHDLQRHFGSVLEALGPTDAELKASQERRGLLYDDDISCTTRGHSSSSSNFNSSRDSSSNRNSTPPRPSPPLRPQPSPPSLPAGFTSLKAAATSAGAASQRILGSSVHAASNLASRAKASATNTSSGAASATSRSTSMKGSRSMRGPTTVTAPLEGAAEGDEGGKASWEDDDFGSAFGDSDDDAIFDEALRQGVDASSTSASRGGIFYHHRHEERRLLKRRDDDDNDGGGNRAGRRAKCDVGDEEVDDDDEGDFGTVLQSGAESILVEDPRVVAYRAAAAAAQSSSSLLQQRAPQPVVPQQAQSSQPQPSQPQVLCQKELRLVEQTAQRGQEAPMKGPHTSAEADAAASSSGLMESILVFDDDDNHDDGS